MNLWKTFLKLAGWKFDVSVPLPDKCVICVAPHTSNWDFILGLAAYRSLGRKANFLIKDFWFFWPMKYLISGLGGIPVGRGGRAGKTSLTQQVIDRFNESSYLNLAVTPEGTRSYTSQWKTGFLYIAVGAGVPVLLASIDYGAKHISISRTFHPSGDIERDLEEVRNFYRTTLSPTAARYPDKFEA
ncbi:MAG: 1-acyl-sn-glycerol-3-phosphate acyltransferase [Muribaculaceae bacterium]|nr:1-acyl-sn-glycerol-3-phosphate acyltransferase [Muribaculaceae bacterium]